MRMRLLWVAALTAACGNGGGFDGGPSDPPVSNGTVSLAWSVTNTNGQPIDCNDVGAQSVVLLLHNILEVGGSTAVFGCSSGAGITQQLSPGSYEIDFELRGTAGVLGTSPRRMNIMVRAGQDTPIGAVAFPVNATGGLDLFLRASPAMTNCGPGTSISGMSIMLRRPGGACQMTTFRIEPGARTYSVNCSSSNVVPCIENNQRLTATGVPSGPYTIEVVGKVGAVDCWVANEPLQVPPLGKVLSRTVILSNPGC